VNINKEYFKGDHFVGIVILRNPSQTNLFCRVHMSKFASNLHSDIACLAKTIAALFGKEYKKEITFEHIYGEDGVNNRNLDLGEPFSRSYKKFTQNQQIRLIKVIDSVLEDGFIPEDIFENF